MPWSERRFITIGLGSAGELLVVVYTERGNEYRADFGTARNTKGTQIL